VGHMATQEFEALYRGDPDPWGYETSLYERDKYAATLAACGPGPFPQALELGGSIGVFTSHLAARCRHLVSIDAAPTAVAAARARVRDLPQVEVILGSIPTDISRRVYDLVVASEILYYLPPTDLEGTLATLAERMHPGARLVAVHWRPAGRERPFTADQVHARLCGQRWLRHLGDRDTDGYRLDILERR
jgi:predicted TPR repeat methyltransferase